MNKRLILLNEYKDSFNGHINPARETVIWFLCKDEGTKDSGLITDMSKSRKR